MIKKEKMRVSFLNIIRITNLKTLLVTIIWFSIFNNIYPAVRYVSHTGSSTPPYTSWQTAADSIQKCIDYSSAGDTIYVASGVYKEKIVIINKFLIIIGSGWDSCIVDSRDLEVPTGFYAFNINGDIIFKGFKIIVSNFNSGENSYKGCGIAISEASDISLIVNNKIENCYKGCDIFNSNAVFKNNIVKNAEVGIHLEAFNENYFPVIDSNVIITDPVGYAFAGIVVGFGTSSYIRNNIIINENGGDGMHLILNPKEIKNNLVLQKGVKSPAMVYYSLETSLGSGKVENNLVLANYPTEGFFVFRGSNEVTNNISSGTKYRLRADTIKFKYNNAWHTSNPFDGYTVDSTNLTVDPMFVNEDSTDFHLQKYSTLIDRGDPKILDKDGSRSDIGLYGGLLGESYKYRDLAPRPPANLTARVDSGKVFLKWNKNTEADFKHYKIYRDTAANFTADSTKLISVQTDTFFVQIADIRLNNLYYKLIAVDNQGNISGLSEELAVSLTSVNNYKPIEISNYKLYQNYPNPFNPSTIISYRLKERGYVKLAVYDIKGALIKYLINEEKNAGYYETVFNAASLASGIYLYKIDIKNNNQIPIYTEIKKMLLLK